MRTPGPLIERPAADEHTAYYGRYVDRVPDGADVLALLEERLEATPALFRGLGEEDSLRRYAPGKWSVREVLGHMADCERIFTYRALRAARGDATPLPGFEEDDYVREAHFDERTTASLVEEWEAVRRATITLYRGFAPDRFGHRTVASGSPVSVRALVYITAGHELHHLNVLRERYGVG
ncbi:MAG TPA: DinB family protein [Longimicrobiaceae bacterium]